MAFDDLQWLGETAGAELLGQRFLKALPAPPLAVSMDVLNRTSTPLNTRIISDTFRNVLLNSGRMRFVNNADRDALLHNAGQSTVTMNIDARLAAGKKLGARYVCHGWLTETRDLRANQRGECHYQLAIELTEVASGLVIWSTKKERRIALLP